MDSIQKSSQFNVKFLQYEIIPAFDLNTHSQLQVKFQNVGQKDWPQKVQMRLVGENQENVFYPVESLKVNEVSHVMIILPQIERYSADWRISFLDNGNQSYFGPTLSLDIQLSKSESGQEKVKLNFVYEAPNIQIAQALLEHPVEKQELGFEGHEDLKYDVMFSDLKIDACFEPNQHSSFKVTIRNVGQDLPNLVLIKRVCDDEINGFQTIRPLKYNEQATFKIFFLAPSKLAKYRHEWRLSCQDTRNGQITQFGPSLCVEFEVIKDVDKQNNQKVELVNAINDVFGGNRITIQTYVDQVFLDQKFKSIDDSMLQVADALSMNDKFLN